MKFQIIHNTRINTIIPIHHCEHSGIYVKYTYIYTSLIINTCAYIYIYKVLPLYTDIFKWNKNKHSKLP